MSSFVTIETERLRLRPFEASDFEAFAAMNADPGVMQYLGDGNPLGRVAAWFQMAAFVGHWHLRGFGEWAAEEKATGDFVGRVGLQRPEGWPDTEVGWMLSRRHWGKGYAYEGGYAALQFVFDHLNLDRVISMIHPDNTASIRVAERLGESLEKRLTINNRDRLIYSIERATFRTLASKRPAA